MQLLPLVEIAYWLALSTWFGGVLFVAVAAPIIFRTVRESDPLLPRVLSVNLEGQHGTLLAGTIVSNLLAALGRIHLICAGVLLVALLLKWIFQVGTMGDRDKILAVVRSVLYLAATILLLYDRFSVWPRIMRHRQQYLDHADEPDVANPAKEAFDRQHKESVTILSIILALLLGMILFSAGATQSVTLRSP